MSKAPADRLPLQGSHYALHPLLFTVAKVYKNVRSPKYSSYKCCALSFSAVLSLFGSTDGCRFFDLRFTLNLSNPLP